MMTVGELKNLIRDLPDHRPVSVLVDQKPYAGALSYAIYSGSGIFQSSEWGMVLCLYTFERNEPKQVPAPSRLLLGPAGQGIVKR
jgi:hypothetical protein